MILTLFCLMALNPILRPASFSQSQGDQLGRQANLRIATEPGNYVGGHKSLEMKLPISQTETVNSVLKRLNPEETVLYIRAYEKFDA